MTLTEIMNFGRYAVYAGYAGYAGYAEHVGYAWKMSVQIKRGILTLTKIVLNIHIEFLSSSYNVIDFGLQYIVLLESAWAQEGKCLCF